MLREGAEIPFCPHNRIVLFCVKGHSHQVFLWLGPCGRDRGMSLPATDETSFRPAVMPSIHFSPHIMAHAFICGALSYPIHSLIMFVNKLVGTCGRCPPSALEKKNSYKSPHWEICTSILKKQRNDKAAFACQSSSRTMGSVDRWRNAYIQYVAWENHTLFFMVSECKDTKKYLIYAQTPEKYLVIFSLLLFKFIRTPRQSVKLGLGFL